MSWWYDLFWRGPAADLADTPPAEPPPLLPPPSPPPIDPAVFQTIAKAPVFNPSDEDQVTFASYRADAIARDIEQRRDEGREKHDEHEKMIAEAMSYAWMLVGAGKWTYDDVRGFTARMMGR